MKIERINENQIRCTLDRQDLDSRQLRINELSYGSPKTKKLFKDVMRQAQVQVGFEAEDLPLAIEAIPTSADSLVIVITKVEDPEELDTRFARFNPAGPPMQPAAEDLMRFIKKQGEASKEEPRSKGKGEAFSNTATKTEAKEESPEPELQMRVFGFDSMHNLISMARKLQGRGSFASRLFKTPAGQYILTLKPLDRSGADFDRASNMITEYGNLLYMNRAGLAYLEEHGKTLLPKDALSALARIGP